MTKTQDGLGDTLAMPSNLDLVRSMNAAWERGDYSSAEWADPQIEFVIADGPAAGSWTGPAGMAAGFRDWLSAWDGFRGEVEEYRELDDERILVLARFSARGKRSGLEAQRVWTAAANVFHIRDGRITRFVIYWDREHALADLGLAPDGEATDRSGE
jgi:ketosteroid isomerase-like protein